MSVGGMTEVMLGIDHGAKLNLLRIETQVGPYSLFAKRTIKSIKELRGKTVIVGGAKDVTLVYFERMAAANGLKPGDYDLIYAGHYASAPCGTDIGFCRCGHALSAGQLRRSGPGLSEHR